MGLFSSEKIVSPVIVGASIDATSTVTAPADGDNSAALASTSYVAVKRKQVVLTTAQLLAIQTTAINIVPAPGAGFLLVPLQLVAQYKFGATAYTLANADNAFRLQFTGKTVSLASFLAVGLVDQVVNEVGWVIPVTPITAIAQTNAANLGLELKLAIGTTPALTLGDGSLTITLEYAVVAMS